MVDCGEFVFARNRKEISHSRASLRSSCYSRDAPDRNLMVLIWVLLQHVLSKTRPTIRRRAGKADFPTPRIPRLVEFSPRHARFVIAVALVLSSVCAVY